MVDSLQLSGQGQKPNCNWLRVVGVAALGGYLLAACGGGPTATPSNGGVSSNATTDLAWMNTVAEPINKKLNADQNAIDSSAAAMKSGNSDAAKSLLLSIAAMDRQLAVGQEKLAAVDEGTAHISPNRQVVRTWNDMIVSTSTYSIACGKAIDPATASPSQTQACSTANAAESAGTQKWNAEADSVRRAAGLSVQPAPTYSPATT
jgi:hypothetical protein